MRSGPSVMSRNASDGGYLVVFNQRNAPRPAVNMNPGAQKCVTQRVKNSTGVVRARSVGDDDIAAR